MDLLITCSETDKETRILSNTDFKKHYSAVNQNMSYDSILPELENATRKYLIKYIGVGSYKEIVKYLTTSTDEQKEILLLAQRIVCNFAMYLYLPLNTATVADGGIVESANDKVASAAKWKVMTMMWQCQQIGDQSIDELIVLLQKNKTDPATIKWKEDESYTRYIHPLFADDYRLSKYVPVEGWRAYTRMFPNIMKADLELSDNLCTDYSATITAIKEDNASDEQKQLAEYIRSYLSHKGFLDSIPYVTMILDGDGWKIISSSDTFDTRSNAATNFTIKNSAPISALNTKLNEDIATIKDRILKYMANHPTVFTAFATAAEDVEHTFVVASDDCIGAVGLF